MALSHSTLSFFSNFPHQKSKIRNPRLPSHTLPFTLKNNPGLILLCSPLPRPSTSEETNTIIPNHFEKAPVKSTLAEVHYEGAHDDTIDTNHQAGKAGDEAIENDAQNEKAPIEMTSSKALSDDADDEAIQNEAHNEQAAIETISSNAKFDYAPEEAINTGRSLQNVPDEALTVEEQPEELSNEMVSKKYPSTITMARESLAVESLAVKSLDTFNMKLEYNDSFPIIIYGTSALLALRIFLAIVGAVDSVPLFPKLFEVVGLAYAVWFSSRYLIFKKNRDVLFGKIEDLKQQIIGSADD